MRIATTLLTVALAVVSGCKKNETAHEGSGSAAVGSGSATTASGSGSGSGSAEAGSGSAVAAGSGSAMTGSGSAGSGSASQLMSHRAVNCPSTVQDSKTTVAVKGKDVILTVSGKTPDAIDAIQKRTDAMLASHVTKKAPGEAHDQKGTHGQTIGICPVHVPEGATASAKHTKEGVAITIKPKDPAALKAEIDVRIQRAADWLKTNGAEH
jgi:hypothetical protein